MTVAIEDDILRLAVASRVRNADDAVAVERLTLAAVEAFFAEDFRPAAAFERCRHLAVVAGRRAALRGITLDALTSTFYDIANVCLVTLRPLLSTKRGLTPGPAKRLAKQFVDDLYRAMRAGHEVVSRWLHLPPKRRRDEVLQELFVPDPVPKEILVAAGIDTSVDRAPLVWVDGQAPIGWRDRLDLLTSDDRRAALVRDDQVDDLVPELGAARVIIGPAHRTHQVYESLLLTRRGAAALRAGKVAGSGVVTRCEAIVDSLAVEPGRELADLLIAKHLHGFDSVRPARRATLGRVLLAWLESRDSIADIGRQLHIARATVHEQLNVAKALVGPACLDPNSHVGVVKALHAAIPRWECDE